MGVRANGVRQESAHASGGGEREGDHGRLHARPHPLPSTPATGPCSRWDRGDGRVQHRPRRQEPVPSGHWRGPRDHCCAMSPLGAVAPLPSASTGIVQRSIPGAAIDTRHEGKERGGAGNAGGGWGARVGGGGADVSWLTSDTSCIIASSPSSAVPAALPSPPSPLSEVQSWVCGCPSTLLEPNVVASTYLSIPHLVMLLLARIR